MQFHFHAKQRHFHKNGFALRLTLKQRHKRTRKMAYSGLPDASVSTRVLVQNFSHEHEFDLHKNEHEGRKGNSEMTCLKMNGETEN